MMSVTQPVVLALNSGSSSLKFGLYTVAAGSAAALSTGSIETTDDHGAFFDHIEKVLRQANAPPPAAIGHRVVHGGPHRSVHCLIDDAVVSDLTKACAFAPLHGPAALLLIRVARERYPALPQVACFDTAFHATMPDVAQTMPIPRSCRAEGIRRYGFHGLSCESIVRQLGPDLPSRLVIAHLGNGASITAVRDGRSVDTSMGLTPSGGVVMGTRSGDLDPGILLYLLREKGLGGAALAALIDHQSGMLGVSALSGDMRALRAAAPNQADADLAIRIFCQSVRKQIAAMMAVLGGLDMLVLTGGIGENDAATRRDIQNGLGWSRAHRTLTLPSLEDEEIALHTANLLP